MQIGKVKKTTCIEIYHPNLTFDKYKVIKGFGINYYSYKILLTFNIVSGVGNVGK